MSYWFGVMKDIAGQKYVDQIAYLRENYGFSQAHANAVVLYSKGNTTSTRFSGARQYLKERPKIQRETMQQILDSISRDFPNSEVVIAWNHPMIKEGGQYLVGMSAARHHITLAPWGGVLADFEDRLADYTVKKKTLQVPNDWQVNRRLLKDLVAAAKKNLKK